MVTIAAMADFIDITRLLHPKSIAVIGAADCAGDLGSDTLRQLVRFGFPGPVWAVNPNAAEMHGVPCFASVADLPEPPDIAILAVPADVVAETIRTCATLGTRNGVMLAGGAGPASQEQVAAACRDTGFVLCGPNSAGIIDAVTPVVAGFAAALVDFATPLRAGPISMVAQGGGIGIAVLSLVQRAGFGFRHLISTGDQTAVRFADYLHALAHDEATRIIAAHLEGLDDAERLVKAVEVARAQGKQMVMIRSDAALAPSSDAQVFDAILQELGVIQVHSVEALVDTCLLLAGSPAAKLPRGPGIGIVTVGGGNGRLAADQCMARGLSVPALASTANPMKLAFPVDALAQFPVAMSTLAAEPGIDALLLVVGPLGVPAGAMAETIIGFARDHAGPICVSWLAPPRGVVARFAEAGIACFAEPDRALLALSHVVGHVAALARPRRGSVPLMKFEWDAHVEPDVHVVTEDRCHAILIDAGLPVAPGRLAIDAAAALPIAHEVGLPVVLRGVGPLVSSRAAAGLSATDLRNADEVLAAFRRLEDRARAQDVGLDGIYVQQMQRGGVELLMSVYRMPAFGTMVSCGPGGDLGATLGQVVTARAPISESMSADMIGRLCCRAAAYDVSGPLDVAAPAAFLARLSQLGASAPWPEFTFDVNPIRWTRSGVVAVHLLLTIGGAHKK